MKEQYRFILDMDGTLYRFDRGQGDMFTASRFYADLRENIYAFFVDRLGIQKSEAIAQYERIKKKYRGEVSLGVEQEFGINRYDYFGNTWNMDPGGYIEKDADLPVVLDSLKGRLALLTAAPRVWAVNVLAFLEIEDAFEGNIFTGEPDIRKPSPLVFQAVADRLGTTPPYIFSIGDQEQSDIIPAKAIGMRGVLIGSLPESIADYQASNVKLAIETLQKEGFV